MRTVVITQSNYIPWRGYFAMLAQADDVILLESVQYTKRDWRNRNTIKTPSGLQWLTIPVDVKGKYFQAIDETRIADPNWAEQHIRSLEANYRRSAEFESVAPWLFEILRAAGAFPLLTQVNSFLLGEIARRLALNMRIRRCTDVLPRSKLVSMTPTDRLLNLCCAAGATRYVSGPAAKDYMELEKFDRAGIEVTWMDYSGFPEYPQAWGTFEPHVSIVDLLLNCGESSRDYLQRTA
jgi:hypothetical protein